MYHIPSRGREIICWQKHPLKTLTSLLTICDFDLLFHRVLRPQHETTLLEMRWSPQLGWAETSAHSQDVIWILGRFHLVHVKIWKRLVLPLCELPLCIFVRLQMRVHIVCVWTQKATAMSAMTGKKHLILRRIVRLQQSQAPSVCFSRYRDDLEPHSLFAKLTWRQIQHLYPLCSFLTTITKLRWKKGHLEDRCAVLQYQTTKKDGLTLHPHIGLRPICTKDRQHAVSQCGARIVPQAKMLKKQENIRKSEVVVERKSTLLQTNEDRLHGYLLPKYLFKQSLQAGKPGLFPDAVFTILDGVREKHRQRVLLSFRGHASRKMCYTEYSGPPGAFRWSSTSQRACC